MVRESGTVTGEGTTVAGVDVGPPGPEEGKNDEALRLRADIAQTREQIGCTIEALQQKLSPAALTEQAKTAVREATIGKVETMVHDAENRITRTGQSIFDTIRDNPFPAALVGVGLAWLYMSRRRAERYGYEHGYGHRRRAEMRRGGDDFVGEPRPYFEHAEGEAGEIGQTMSEKAKETGQAISDKAKETGQAISDKAHQAGHAISDKAHQAGHAISEKAHDAGRAVRRYAHEAGESGRRFENRLEGAYRDNPLAAGAVVMAAGTAIGLAIPISRKEDEWMGEARDQVVGKAAELAQEALGKVENAAREVGKGGSAAEDLAKGAERALEQPAR